MASQPSSGAVTVADNNQTECKSRSNQNNALVLQNERSRNPFLTASAPPAATVSQVSSNGIIQLAPAQHGSKNHPSATQSHSSRQETSPSHRLRPSNARTKQTLDNAPGKDGSGGNSDEEDRNTKRQKISSSSSEDPLTRRQACPYYKRDPHTHQTSACMGPGFDTFAKLKYCFQKLSNDIEVDRMVGSISIAFIREKSTRAFAAACPSRHTVISKYTPKPLPRAILQMSLKTI
jgi:hypothetical protein